MRAILEQIANSREDRALKRRLDVRDGVGTGEAGRVVGSSVA